MQTVRETFADFTFCSLLYMGNCTSQSVRSASKTQERGSFRYWSFQICGFVHLPSFPQASDFSVKLTLRSR